MFSEQVNPKELSEQLKDEQAKNALACFLKDIGLLHTYSDAVKTRRVFFSYAWDDPINPSFRNLQNFLKILKKSFDDLCLQSFLDLFSMAGDIEGRMREGIEESDLIILMGTRIYSQKTKTDSDSNVNKELEYAIKKMEHLKCERKSKNYIIFPLTLEGSNSDIFHRLGFDYMMSNLSAWFNLDTGVYSMPDYINFLTALDPPGLLPLAFKLEQPDYAHSWFKIAYTNAQEVLRKKIDAIYANNYLPALFAGTPEQLYEAGQAQEKAKNFTAAYEAYRLAANKNHIKAKTCLGLFFLHGIGTAQDKSKGYSYSLSAAEQGHPRAMYNLARIFEKGDGVPQNYIQALHWYTKAAEAGNAQAFQKVERVRTLVKP